ncbi:lipopolysaccharide biosynthesis protein [Vibrio sinaloensis]|uniref:O-antigen translocase n=1 Tax=Photobacterium sp. (strain ATCC 43367) TaxID=379097 RepID=UPI00057C6978|nr:O-antigen translocase [Vibrio sinaloensis]KIE19465.1 lipopolysaccharide biosynthesis protein [Vibrio sinaloensis]
MNLIKTSILSFVATAIKILAGLVINKAVSIFIGPAGLAAIGQFQNALGIIQTFAKGGINSGVTKYTAEYNDDIDSRRALWSTSLKLTLICSGPISVILVFLSSYISEYIFKTDNYAYVFVVFGFTLALFSINQLLLSILNGLKEIRTFISINIIQSIYSLIFTTLLIVFFKLDGALIAMVTNQSVIFIIVLWKLREHKKIIVDNFNGYFDTEQSKKLLSYSLMALISAFTAPVSLMVVRDYIGENVSWDAAGYWQAMTYISTMYLMVITTALSTYYLPRLSEIKGKSELREELKKGYLVLLPLVIVLSALVYVLKDFVIWALFTEDFKAMRELFRWQLIGDVFKISSWLVAYLMLAKALTKMFIITEIVFAFSYTLLSLLLVDKFGVVGATYSYALNYVIYLIFMIVLMRKHIFD